MSFALVGGLAFFMLSPVLPFGKDVIRLDARTRTQVAERRASALGRELSEDERQRALDDYIDSEILLRESYRKGRHRELSRVRQRLVLAMRTALSEDIPAPSDPELRAYFSAHRDDYTLPASVTWSHVFFSLGDSGAAERASRSFAALSRGEDFRSMGDRFAAGSLIERSTHARLAIELGESFADELFSLRGSDWHGPLVSTLGHHLVRIESRVAESVPDFADVKRYVELDWRTERQRTSFERQLERMRERYDVRIER